MGHEPSDAELVSRWRQGDETAYDTLVRRYRGRLERYFAWTLRLGAEREDLSQEVFLRLWRVRDTVDAANGLGAWLFTVAHHLGISATRKQRWQGLWPGRKSLGESETGGDQDGAIFEPATQRTPERASEDAALRVAYVKALTSLPAAQREAYLLSEEGGLSYEDIARIAHCPVGTVASRKYLAVSRLRQELQPFWGV